MKNKIEKSAIKNTVGFSKKKYKIAVAFVVLQNTISIENLYNYQFTLYPCTPFYWVIEYFFCPILIFKQNQTHSIGINILIDYFQWLKTTMFN